MSQFDGNKFKVRCIDCNLLNNGQCTSKKTKVSPKKKRICTSYSFKGSYENHPDANSRYIPYIDKKTRKLLKQLISPAVGSEIRDREGFEHVKSFAMPTTTATEEGLSGPADPSKDIYG